MGRLTISLFLEPGCEIDRFTLMADGPSARDLRNILATVTESSTIEMIERYQAHADSRLRRDRDGLVRRFMEWALTEGLI